jgi:TetR/AcrR family transcriptional repressor of nem operon
MARPREFDDGEAVLAARGVFWEHGYSPTSLAQLESATGLSRSSLYATYGSKRGLFERASKSYLNDIIAPALSPMESPGAGKDELIGYFQVLTEFVRASGPECTSNGCMMLNTALELNDLDAQATEMVRGFRERTRLAILNALRSIESIDDPEGTANILTATQMGMMVTSRFDTEQAVNLGETMAARIRAW